jgi:hypothetical protein
MVGIAAMAWAANVLPVFWRQASVERIAGRITDYDKFNADSLQSFLPTIDVEEQSPYCRPELLHGASLVRMRLAEDAMAAGDRKAIDGRLAALQSTIERSLACAPTDAFLWVALAWLSDTTEGFRPEQLQYLRLSYQLGPNEGWIAARRNRVALSMFGRLPPDLADDAISEFAHMVDSWIYTDTIAILTGPGWPIHDRLLASLKDVGRQQREALAKALYERGYNVAVPGVAARNPRPWD